MSKYDFGYVLQEGTTNKWAYDQIEPGTKVLELGASVGCLTYNLFHKKECIVDIVEIDKESGEKAKRYANRALLGEKYGDLNSNKWYQKFKNNRYDYVVCLDVLEHLKSPEETLSKMKSILSENGRVIISIPNITHNAVMLQMCKNKFKYSQLGLLDETHIHFFSYDSIVEVMQKVGLNIYVLDGIKKHVSETEFEDILNEFPLEVSKYFRTREKGDVYQYLLIAGNSVKETKDLLGTGITENSLYESKILIDGLSKNEKIFRVNPDNISIQIDLEDYQDAQRLAFFPLEQDVLVSNLMVIVESEYGEKREVYPNWTMGSEIDKKTYALYDEKYGINILIPPESKKMNITCECTLLDAAMLKVLKKTCL